MLGPGSVRAASAAIALFCAVAAEASEDTASNALTPQTCETSVHPDAQPADRFSDIGGGSVADRRLGLVWQRCALGQVWERGTCTGAPAEMSWHESRQAAARLNASGQAFFDDWRLPRIHELATIVEIQCRNPRIDLTLFPATPPAAFWSATPIPPGGGDAAYMLSFGADGVGHDSTDARHLVRLVRTGP